jgi:hypothetical protein
MRAKRFAAFAASLAVAVATSAILVAQVRPVPTPTPMTPSSPLKTTQTTSSKRDTITIDGCLQGSSLEPFVSDAVLDLYKASAYELEISKGMREQLMGHQGHAERVTGTLTVPSDPSRVAGTKQIGKKTSVTVAAGLTTATDIGVPGIAVTKVEHIHDTCAALGKKDNPARDSNPTIGPASK